MRLYLLLSTLLVIITATASRAEFEFPMTFYTQNFNIDDTANWNVNNGPGDAQVDFYYDYSAIGVPPAPNGTGTRGLKMSANNFNNVMSGVTVSPKGQFYTGVFTISFDIWQNYVGPLGTGGNGSTQFSQYGFGTSGTTPQWIGTPTKDGISFGTTLDGGLAHDYRIYAQTRPASYPSGHQWYLAPSHSTNNSDTFYTTTFPSVPGAPAAQVALYPGQTGATDPGETAFKWHHVYLQINGNFGHWYIDDVQMGFLNLNSEGGWHGNIFFGHSDIDSFSSPDPNRVALNATIIDNIKVTGIPGPSSVGLCLLGTLGCITTRRRNQIG